MREREKELSSKKERKNERVRERKGGRGGRRTIIVAPNEFQEGRNQMKVFEEEVLRTGIVLEMDRDHFLHSFH